MYIIAMHIRSSSSQPCRHIRREDFKGLRLDERLNTYAGMQSDNTSVTFITADQDISSTDQRKHSKDFWLDRPSNCPPVLPSPVVRLSTFHLASLLTLPIEVAVGFVIAIHTFTFYPREWSCGRLLLILKKNEKI